MTTTITPPPAPSAHPGGSASNSSGGSAQAAASGGVFLTWPALGVLFGLVTLCSSLLAGVTASGVTKGETGQRLSTGEARAAALEAEDARVRAELGAIRVERARDNARLDGMDKKLDELGGDMKTVLRHVGAK